MEAQGRVLARLTGFVAEAQVGKAEALEAFEMLVETTRDKALLEALTSHRDETEMHKLMLEQRLRALGGQKSHARERGSLLKAAVKGFSHASRSDRAAKNLRDAYVNEHLEISTQELIERVASSIGDTATASMAQKIRADDERMAETIAASWDQIAALVTAVPRSRS